MLIQFSVENYLSIKDKVVLSLLASKDKEHPDFLINHDNKKCLKMLQKVVKNIIIIIIDKRKHKILTFRAKLF